MNGKQSKLLRKINRADKKSKRLFNAMDGKTKGALRDSVMNYMNYGELIKAELDKPQVSETSDNGDV